MKYFILLALIAFSFTACKTTKEPIMDDGEEMMDDGEGMKAEAETKTMETKTTVTVVELSPVPTSVEALESTNILFGYDKDSIDAKHAPIITAVSDLLKTGTSIIHVVGHADERADSAYNVDLGKRRAASVKAALVAKGLDGTRLMVMSHGEKHPLVKNADTKLEYHLNRRVTFDVEGMGEDKEKNYKMEASMEEEEDNDSMEEDDDSM